MAEYLEFAALSAAILKPRTVLGKGPEVGHELTTREHDEMSISSPRCPARRRALGSREGALQRFPHKMIFVVLIDHH